LTVNEFYTKIRSEAKIAVSELIEAAKLEAGDILVIGCSSSEIVGGHIGKASSPDTANAVFEEIYTVLKEKGIWLAAQCCEHLNRAIIIEKACAERYGYEIVNVKPQPKAGGSFATAAYSSFERPVAVEHIKAHAGMDIGETLIGMHLRDVAVPVRLSVKRIGEANVIFARTRAKFIGGSRAIYEE
jgi:uncharacterized protein (TIGR01440 family)